MYTGACDTTLQECPQRYRLQYAPVSPATATTAVRVATLLLLIGPVAGWKLRELAASDCVGKTTHGQRSGIADPEDKYDVCDVDTWHGRTCDQSQGGSSCDQCTTSCDKPGFLCCDGGCTGCCDDNCAFPPMPPQLPSPAYPPSSPPHSPSPPFAPPSPSAPPSPPSAPPKRTRQDQGLSVLDMAFIISGVLVAVGCIIGSYPIYKLRTATSKGASPVPTGEAGSGASTPTTLPRLSRLPRLPSLPSALPPPAPP